MKRSIAWALALVLLLGTLVGCSGKSDTVISAAAFHSETVLSLPLKAELNNGDFMSYGGYQFETSASLDKMSDLIAKNNENVIVEAFENAYGKCRLFTRDNGSGTDSWCLYELDPANMHNWYIFSGEHREISTKDGALDLLLPLHLISDNFVRDNMGNRLKPDTAYACGANGAELSPEELFCKFYETSGLYTVTQLDNGFAVTPKQGVLIQLRFTFDEHDGSQWFTISDITERDPVPTENVSVRWIPADGSEAVSKTLIAEDALQLSSLLITLNYADGTTPSDYPYSIDADGETYNARVFWENDAWTGSAEHNGKTAAMSTEQACEFAAIAYINGIHDATLTESPDVSNALPMAACMKATTEVNIRFEPNSGASILRTSHPEEPFAVTGKSGDWYQILMDKTLYYMNMDYLH